MSLIKLISASESEVKMMADVLKQKNIFFRITDENPLMVGVYRYGVARDKEIIVNKEDLNKAKELLNISDGENKNKKSLLLRVYSWVVLLLLLGLLVISIIRIFNSL